MINIPLMNKVHWLWRMFSTISITFFFHVLFFVSTLNAYEYEIRGNVHYQALRNIPRTYPGVNFCLSVSNNLWHFYNTPIKPAPFSYYEFSYDGVYLYYLISFYPKDKLRESGFANSQPDVANAFIFDHGEVPHRPTVHEVGPVWLAFSSAHYFHNLKDNMIEPVISAGVTVDLFSNRNIFRQRAIWTTFSYPPRLVSKVIYFHDGVARSSLQDDNLIMSSRRNVTNHFSKEFTNAVYTVVNVTNIYGFEFPLYSVLHVYKPTDKSGSKLKELGRYDIHTLSITNKISVTSFVPEILGPTIISEERTKHIKSRAGRFSYLATNWPSVEVVLKSDRYKRNLRMLGISEQNPAYIVLFLMLVLSSVPLIFYYSKMYKSEKSTQYKYEK